MAAIVKGPFTLKWGDNVIQAVEDISVDYSQDSEDFNTVQGKVYEIDGPIKATVTLTVLKSDIPVLAALLPQHHVANGGVLSTGETVNEANGAIDLKATNCDEAIVYNNLDIISCASQAQVFRIVNARTKLDSLEFSNKLQKVMIKFIGEPSDDEASVQFVEENSISVVS